MGLVTGTALTNGSDVIDAVRSALAGEGFTTVINDGTVVSNNKEVWMNKPAAENFNGLDMTIGMSMSGTDLLQVTITHFTPTEALLTPPGSPSAGRNVYLRALGCPNNTYHAAGAEEPPGNTGDVYPTGFVLSGNNNHEPARMDKMNQGANYLRHWIFTPEQSPTGAAEWYCYVVVEVATGIFRSMAFGEGIKLGGAGWSGGLFVNASEESSVTQLNSMWLLAGDAVYNGFTWTGEAGYILNLDNPSMNSTISPSTWNPWVQMMGPWSDGWVSCAGMGPRYLGEDFIERSPANFSGQAIRIPARFYQQNVRVSASYTNRMRPLLECRDFFHVNISAFTPGSTVTDDGETFLVVPYVAKTGTDNSGNFGFLIRNPNL